ncbi:MAG: response regulator [Lachnospiraceae bacterium]
MKVIICDDSAFMRNILRNMILRISPETEIVAEAANGKEAIEQYKIHRPDLVTLDITMPVMNGLDALKEIRQYDPNAVVAMVSAISQQPVIIDAIKHGAIDFIIKPFTVVRLVELLNRIQRHRTRV